MVSARAGTSGKSGERAVDVTASARKEPARICWMIEGMLSKINWTWPPSMSVIAGAAPPIGHVLHLGARHHHEHFTGQMHRGAVARRRHVHLARVRLHIGD